MQISDRRYTTALKNKSIRVVILTALFNESITSSLARAAESELVALGAHAHLISKIQVPGAWELPVAAKKIFQSSETDAIIACGCVIRGDTGHYEIVATQSAAGLMAVGLEFSRPVMNAVLTVENSAQAEARARDDSTNKGAEAAQALVELLNNLEFKAV
jgi:6,7-dimethyl-8-ribityllumazine synthase